MGYPTIQKNNIAEIYRFPHGLYLLQSFTFQISLLYAFPFQFIHSSLFQGKALLQDIHMREFEVIVPEQFGNFWNWNIHKNWRTQHCGKIVPEGIYREYSLYQIKT